jgi:Cd2+/Zn2+-exporting ATPase
VRSPVGEQIVEIGSLKLWDETPGGVPDEIRRQVLALQAAGRSIVVVRWGERWLGVLGVMDQPRPKVRETLNALRTSGVRSLVMLTGDNEGVGAAVGSEVGVDEVHADLLPEDKAGVIKEMLKTHHAVAMVGDGVNDAPALAQATVGIAMGGAGTAVALETADVALMGDDLSRLPFAIALSRRARSIIRQNVVFALAVIAVLIIAGATGFATIGPAVLLHEGSTILVVLNALRLLAFDTPRT